MGCTYLNACIFYLQLESESWKLIFADFKTGATVFKDDVHLVRDEDGTKITSTEGERTFLMWDFLTMLGSFVEFDTFNSNPQVRCVFEDPVVARGLFSFLKPNPNIEV